MLEPKNFIKYMDTLGDHDASAFPGLQKFTGEFVNKVAPFDHNRKDTNPKDAIGVRKTPISALPIRVLWRVGLAMLEGAAKYGRHNYRAAGVRASVYFDAVVARHLFQWWEGEDIDQDSGLSHIDKAIAGLMVLRDSMLQGNWVDDRPPSICNNMDELNAHAGVIIDRHADKSPHHYTNDDTRQAQGAPT